MKNKSYKQFQDGEIIHDFCGGTIKIEYEGNYHQGFYAYIKCSKCNKKENVLEHGTKNKN